MLIRRVTHDRMLVSLSLFSLLFSVFDFVKIINKQIREKNLKHRYRTIDDELGK
jgi:hypothetical protein